MADSATRPPYSNSLCVFRCRLLEGRLAASDYGTILTIIVSVVIGILLTHRDPVQDQSMIVLGLMAIYYYTGAWLLERRYAHHLEQIMSRWARALEYTIRICVFLLLGLALALITNPDWTGSFIVLFFIFLLFWDIIIDFGGKPRISKQFYIADGSGLIVSTVYVVTDKWDWLCVFVLAVIIVIQSVLTLLKFQQAGTEP